MLLSLCFGIDYVMYTHTLLVVEVLLPQLRRNMLQKRENPGGIDKRVAHVFSLSLSNSLSLSDSAS